ncbi:MAG TPA: [LysW]-aminoadipate/[LysW]-glutamate kinase [Nitrososphaeraceae archaeon]|jgi:acetylglutamate/LysW-gamma-L-alpha-aminoadipate kinase
MIVIKLGGSIVSDRLDPSTFQDIRSILRNERLVIVHGGGKDVTNVASKLGKEQRFIVSPQGVRSRYTDKETIEIYTMVMSGKINKMIVGTLIQNGIKAIGITGIDGLTIRANRKKKLVIVNERGRKMIIEGGYTGKISSIDPHLIHLLVSEGYVPVISPIALGDDYEFLNIDGDRAAAYIAGGVKAEKILFMTDVEGLMINDQVMSTITLKQAKELLPSIGFGMEKKVLACTEALEMGVNESIIGSGLVENPISSCLSHNRCTVITP